MATLIRSVIFDYGKVLSAPQREGDLLAMASILGLSPDEFTQHYWRYRVEYDEGAVDANTYWLKIAEDAQRQLSDAQIGRLREHDVMSWSDPDPVMLSWAKRLRESGIPGAVLSNMPADLREYVTRRAAWFPQFDHLTFSCDVRLCKPNPAIYKHCLQGLGARSSETLFLDDRPENVAAAQEAGIHSFVFTSPAEARKIIEAAFSLPVSIEC